MSRRVVRLLVPLVAVAGLLAGCGDDGVNDADGTDETTGTADASPSADADGCVGKDDGDVTLLQGQPADLPGGGGAGIGSVDLDADPPTVNLVLAGASGPESATGTGAGVGDVVTVAGADYEVRQICASTVSLLAR